MDKTLRDAMGNRAGLLNRKVYDWYLFLMLPAAKIKTALCGSSRIIKIFSKETKKQQSACCF
jgi:hypothetical protein